MRIESIDFFYISMPVVTDAGDGSQDALLVRVRSGHIEAWGECEASPRGEAEMCRSVVMARSLQVCAGAHIMTSVESRICVRTHASGRVRA